MKEPKIENFLEEQEIKKLQNELIDIFSKHQHILNKLYNYEKNIKNTTIYEKIKKIIGYCPVCTQKFS